ncbi:axial regulator YABBY 5-like [Impatiens glandulifera]|uniref:axial regulator YABBY 5-like n=1 Tax=Impatiens glandulifera TaxID=253017 RepID=UPI001FB0C038|nr:axial regulator YABBY 5-like [Impatiens glandulifera]
MMSSRTVDLSTEQLCYIPCNLCNIVLTVSVPCSRLLETVTVRCGHCTNLWTVNMATAFQSLSSDLQMPNYISDNNYRMEIGSSSKDNNNNRIGTRPFPTTQKRLVNRPPEKKQRSPSVYNQFIKEEIQRIKANNPDISHREAFSTAAKNWAHFPRIHFGLTLDTNQAKLDQDSSKHKMQRAFVLNK